MSERIEKLKEYLQKYRDTLMHSTIQDGVVFWVSRNAKQIFELGDIFNEDVSLRTAIRTVARVGGNARIVLYDNDVAEVRVVDSFQYELMDGVVS